MSNKLTKTERAFLAAALCGDIDGAQRYAIAVALENVASKVAGREAKRIEIVAASLTTSGKDQATINDVHRNLSRSVRSAFIFDGDVLETCDAATGKLHTFDEYADLLEDACLYAAEADHEQRT